MRAMIKLIATGFGLGYVPKLPGTAGSLLGLILVYLFAPLSLWLYLSVLVPLLFLAVWVSGEAEQIFRQKDSPHIVIDEIVGMLVTFVAMELTWQAALAGFVLFRFFDIVKPPPIWQLQKIPGGMGIVLDDVAAGMLANIVLQILTK